MDLINIVDLNILNFIKDNFTNVFMDKIMVLSSTLGNAGIIWISIGLILVSIKKYRRVGVILFIALLINSILGEVIIKNLVQRPRPFLEIGNIELLINRPTSYSFPSGHTASSFAAAGVLANYFKNKKYVFYFIAALIAFSRLYLFVHYPTDILGGILLGLFSSYVTIYIMNKIFKDKKVGIK